MKRFTCIAATILLCGCLFFANATERNKPGNSPVYGNLSFNYHFQPDFLNTFNNLFPIYTFQKEVCRKPSSGTLFLMGDDFVPFSAHYNYQGFSYKSLKLGSHFLKIEGNSIYKQGNSLLLIPHSYIAPVKPAYLPSMPKMVAPKVD